MWFRTRRSRRKPGQGKAGAYYSAPHRRSGQRLWVRASAGKVELFHEWALVATHRRARPGQRRTLLANLPPDEVHFLLADARLVS